jgi:hypothetical protein
VLLSFFLVTPSYVIRQRWHKNKNIDKYLQGIKLFSMISICSTGFYFFNKFGTNTFGTELLDIIFCGLFCLTLLITAITKHNKRFITVILMFYNSLWLNILGVICAIYVFIKYDYKKCKDNILLKCNYMKKSIFCVI